MKKFLVTLTLIFVVALTLLVWGFGVEGPVAEAEDDTVYAYVAPHDLENSEYAGVAQVAVVDNDTTDVLFYLIESYYYPVTASTVMGTTYYHVEIDGLNACIDTANLTESPKSYEGVTLENALPSNLLLKEGVTLTLKSKTVDSTWTIQLLGIIEDSYFVKASFGDTSVFGAVEKTSFTTENVNYHQIDSARREGLLNQTPDEDNDTIGEDGGKQSTLLRIILIVGIAVPAVIIAIMLFKPGRNSAKTNYDRHAMKTRRDDEIDYDRDRHYRDRRDDRRDRDYDRRDDYDRDYRRDRRDYDGRDYDRRDYDRRDYNRRDDRDYDRRDYGRDDRRRDDYDRGYRD